MSPGRGARAAPGRGVVPALPAVFWWLWSGWLVSALANFVLPFLAFFLTERGFPPSRIGLVVSAFGAGGVVAGPCAGSLADAIGRKPTLLLFLVTAGAAAAALAALADPLAIGAAILLFGFSSQAVNAPFQAIVADVVPAPARTRAFDLAYWARNIGASLSLVSGGVLAARGWALPFLLDAGTTLLFALLVLRFVPETLPPPLPGEPSRSRGGLGQLLADRRFVSVLGLHVLLCTALWQLHAGLPIDLARRGMGPGTFGAVLSVNTALVALLQPFASRLTDRAPRPVVLSAGALLVGVGCGGYALFSGPAGVALATALLSLGEIAYLPAVGALVAELAPPALRGRYAGALGLAFGVASFAAPILGSALLEAAGSTALWVACLGACGAAAAGHAVAAGSRPRQAELG